MKRRGGFRQDLDGVLERRGDGRGHRADGRTVAPKKLGVKASGGIRTYADVVRMIQAGATRVGASSSVKIMEEALALAGRKE